MARHWRNQNPISGSTWALGENVVQTPNQTNRTAIRRFDIPGSAYNSDPQLKHLSEYDSSNTSVNNMYNCAGILNHVFYISAIQIEGYSWTKVGQLWLELVVNINYDANLHDYKTLLASNAEQVGLFPEIFYALSNCGFEI